MLGVCIVSRIFDDSGHRVVIVQADDHVLISTSVLDEIRSGCAPECSIDGDLVTLITADRVVVYRLGAVEQLTDCVHAVLVHDHDRLPTA